MDWSLDSYFTGLNEGDYKNFKESLKKDFKTLLKGFSALKEASGGIDIPKLATLITSYEEAVAKYAHISSYIHNLASANASNEVALKEEASLSLIGTDISKTFDALRFAVKGLTKEEFCSLKEEEALNGLASWLDEVRVLSAFLMEQDKESLATDIDNVGSGAFSRLYSKFTGNLTFTYELPDGSSKTVPFSHFRSLLGLSDAPTRKSVFKGLQSCLEQNREVFASALNSISGTRLILNKERGLPHFRDVALAQARITGKSLDAMVAAILEKRDFSRDVLRERSRLMGLDESSYADLPGSIPVSGSSKLDWKSCVSLVSKAFHNAYPNLGDYFDHIIKEKWIDYTPRDSKRPGGYCTSSHLTGETRIYMNYNETMGDLTTLAHEAGHAWHAELLKKQRYFLTDYPMTLAESASTFAEMLFSQGIMNDPATSEADKKLILEADSSRVVSFLLELPVRYLFEFKFYEQRKEGELSARELCDLMVETQTEMFGDTIGEEGVDPYFWAHKLHFYIHETQFYNYPYVFGYLISAALMKRFREKGESFLKEYEYYLSISADGSVESVMKRAFDVDIEQKEFWAEAIESLQPILENLKAL